MRCLEALDRSCGHEIRLAPRQVEAANDNARRLLRLATAPHRSVEPQAGSRFVIRREVKLRVVARDSLAVPAERDFGGRLIDDVQPQTMWRQSHQSTGSASALADDVTSLAVWFVYVHTPLERVAIKRRSEVL
jgi:hypothetical protein